MTAIPTQAERDLIGRLTRAMESRRASWDADWMSTYESASEVHMAGFARDLLACIEELKQLGLLGPRQ